MGLKYKQSVDRLLLMFIFLLIIYPTMSPEELLNLSLQYEVEIEAHTVIEPCQLRTFHFLGFLPLKTYRLPLYVALHLKSLNLCTIRTLPYLKKDYIINLIEKEKKDSNFTEVPEFLFEHSYYFMNYEIESSICELKRLRMNKIWKGLSALDGKAICINGLTKWEFNQYKKFLTESFKFGKMIDSEE